MTCKIDWNAREDDEICTEMRKEQATLRSLQEDIRRRKQILYDIAVEHMAYQEYQAIVEELDKQIELAYIKRYVRRPSQYYYRYLTMTLPFHVNSVTRRRRRLPQLEHRFSSNSRQHLRSRKPQWPSSRRGNAF